MERLVNHGLWICSVRSYASVACSSSRGATAGALAWRARTPGFLWVEVRAHTSSGAAVAVARVAGGVEWHADTPRNKGIADRSRTFMVGSFLVEVLCKSK